MCNQQDADDYSPDKKHTKRKRGKKKNLGLDNSLIVPLLGISHS
jgi:hypothetical protein